MEITNEIMEEAHESTEMKKDMPSSTPRYKTKAGNDTTIIYRDEPKDDSVDADNPFYLAFAKNKDKLSSMVHEGEVSLPHVKTRDATVSITKNGEKKSVQVVEKVSVTVNPKTEESGKDQTFTCVDCGKEFQMTAKNIAWFNQQGFILPKRCPECRKKRKAERSAKA